MILSDECPVTPETVNGWSLTGRRVWGRAWEAEHECGATTGFDSINQFKKNEKHCRGCDWGKPNIDRALAYHFGIYKNSAKKRGLDFTITKDEFLTAVLNVCYYCGEVQEIKYKTYVYLINGIDRINNSLGYVSGNVRTCCRICNVAKGTMTEQEFYEKVEAWHARMQQPGK